MSFDIDALLRRIKPEKRTAPLRRRREPDLSYADRLPPGAESALLDSCVYIDAAKRLDSCKPQDFERTYQAAESTRIAFLMARDALAAHIIEHQCER